VLKSWKSLPAAPSIITRFFSFIQPQLFYDAKL